jgi:hypothetical protein
MRYLCICFHACTNLLPEVTPEAEKFIRNPVFVGDTQAVDGIYFTKLGRKLSQLLQIKDAFFRVNRSLECRDVLAVTPTRGDGCFWRREVP